MPLWLEVLVGFVGGLLPVPTKAPAVAAALRAPARVVREAPKLGPLEWRDDELGVGARGSLEEGSPMAIAIAALAPPRGDGIMGAEGCLECMEDSEARDGGMDGVDDLEIESDARS
jgi:hypothetical protein